ncbi:MAG: hypothetical protein KQJ78_11145 [Deltaproteobacteria bacterium]|nr:hypothetical protein [Deltaproteobacteria bacterium]
MTDHLMPMTTWNARQVRMGLKTQTRRVVKLPQVPTRRGAWEPTTIGGPGGGRLASGEEIPEAAALWHTQTGQTVACHYGQGDRLVIKEALIRGRDGLARYADDEPVLVDGRPVPWVSPVTGRPYQRSSLSSRFCPREWARTVCEVTAPGRVERVQDIRECDASAEGVHPPIFSYADRFLAEHQGSRALCEFRVLWDEINDSRGFGWEANPWVWVIQFKFLAGRQPFDNPPAAGL